MQEGDSKCKGKGGTIPLRNSLVLSMYIFLVPQMEYQVSLPPLDTVVLRSSFLSFQERVMQCQVGRVEVIDWAAI